MGVVREDVMRGNSTGPPGREHSSLHPHPISRLAGTEGVRYGIVKMSNMDIPLSTAENSQH